MFQQSAFFRVVSNLSHRQHALTNRVLVPLHKIKTSTNCGLSFPLFSTSIKALRNSKDNIKRDERMVNDNGKVSRTNATENVHAELPEKPKKPQSAYFLFMAHRREELAKSDTKLPPKDFVKQCSVEWEDLDDAQKKKFQDKYKLTLKEYMSSLVEYKRNLTEEQKEALESISEEIRRKKLLKEKRKFLKESQKPKIPPTAYMLYIVEQHKKSDKSLKEFVQSMKGSWQTLSDHEKGKYVDMYMDLKKQYDMELANWEMKMIDAGRVDVVRRTTVGRLKPKEMKPSSKPGWSASHCIDIRNSSNSEKHFEDDQNPEISKIMEIKTNLNNTDKAEKINSQPENVRTSFIKKMQRFFKF